MSKTPKVLLLIEPSRIAGSGFLRGIARYSALHGPWIFFRNPPFYIESRQKSQLTHRLKQLKPDGIIMLEYHEMTAIEKLGVPTIVSTYTKRQFPGMPAIVCDNEKIGQMAAEHLLNRGFQKFAYCGFEQMFWSVERGKGFCDKVRESGYDVEFYGLQKKNSGWQTEQMAMVKWLKSLPKPLAIMACNDDRALQIIEACHMTNINVPEELAIIGVDNDDLVCGLSNPPLSSVALHFERAGYEAAELLCRLMKGEPFNGQVIRLHEMFIATRQSTDVLAMEDQEIAKTVRYIRQNSRKVLQVTDVLSVVPLSRRSLELRFRKVMGRSIHDEIRRVRVEQAAQMLLETSMSVAQIATTMGYDGFEHFSRYFRQEKGISPQLYRKQHGHL